ncbi:MAG: hypothetical protein OEO82_11385 [Gammaproteobacteria bacterium]|nr:hypothetical protein [Gammaproteobacteria bacterium]
MIGVTASAPGKIVVCGEYAVLDGAPAICMAIDRRARASAWQSDAQYHTVSAPGFAAVCGKFLATAGHFEWLEAGDDFALVEHVWMSANLKLSGSLALKLDTRAFADAASGRKMGIGSSAALTVALTAALHEFAGKAADIALVASAAHRRLQGGAGSGIDVRCSQHGGVIEFRMHSDACKPLRWPEDLAFAVLWSGVSASTRTKLAELCARSPRPARAALAVAAERAAASWAGGSTASILKEMRAYTEALRSFSVDHDLGIFDAGHAELADAATGDVVYKPCGAGGGDVGIVLAHSEDDIASFISAAPIGEFERLDMSVDPQGVQVGRDEY